MLVVGASRIAQAWESQGKWLPLTIVLLSLIILLLGLLRMMILALCQLFTKKQKVYDYKRKKLDEESRRHPMDTKFGIVCFLSGIAINAFYDTVGNWGIIIMVCGGLAWFFYSHEKKDIVKKQMATTI